MIRTYELSHESKTPLYVQLYEAIRADILSGSLPGARSCRRSGRWQST